MRTKLQLSANNFFALPSLQPWVIGVGIILLSSVLEYAGLTHWLRTSVQVVSQPLRQTTAKAVHGLRQPIEFLRVGVLKYTYVLDLELRYAEAAAQLGELEQLRQENQALRSVVEQETASPSTQALTSRRKFGSVISYAQPTIALGRSEGLVGGEVVRVAGTFVGKVTTLSEHQAQVRLLHSAAINDPVLAQVEQGVSGIVTGSGTEVIMKEIPIEAVVQVGQRVETTGQLGIQPGLYIGRVKEVVRQEGSPTQTVIIDQGVSFFRTTVVEVVQ